MLHGNLSTRPFYNERLLHVALGVAAVLLVALTVFSATQFLWLSRQQAQLSSRIAANEQRAGALLRDAEQVRREIDRTELDATVQATREVNRVIDQRVFSWTALFNAIERTIPAPVLLRAVRPLVGDDGVVMVRLVVSAAQIEDVGAFMDRLEQARAFDRMRSLDEQRIEDGSFLVTIEGQYVGRHGATEADGDRPAAAPPEQSAAAGEGV
jgi:hypothetical protein